VQVGSKMERKLSKRPGLGDAKAGVRGEGMEKEERLPTLISREKGSKRGESAKVLAIKREHSCGIVATLGNRRGGG